MTAVNDLWFPILFVALVVALSWPLGWYLTWAMEPARPGRGRAKFEQLGTLLFGSLAKDDQPWSAYARSLLVSNALLFVLVFVILTTQQWLTLNPDGKTNLEPSLAFNTTASFITNTNLQHYSGEVNLSYFSQLALVYLQFVSAASGIAVLAALARSLAGRKTIGNFYVDVWRATVLLLLPMALLWGAFLIASGVPMTFAGAAEVTTLEGAMQTIARGPVAAMIPIKQLGTNGGGYFGPNCAHPLENPTWWTNFANCAAILVIPMACVWMYGAITRRMRHALVVFTVMLVMYLAFTGLALYYEQAPTGAIAGLPVAASSNLEGKELRFGASAGPLWAVTTTSTSNGSVNCMHDSLNSLTGLMPMIGMWLNVEYGGVGVGMINMFLYIVVAVFLAGMMVGRTPEYLARKVETQEMKLALFALLLHPLLILGGTAIFVATPKFLADAPWGTSTIQDPGSHGFSEIVYEFSSAAANNGSGFEGLGDNTIPWNVATGLVMLFGRYIPIILPLGIAAALGAKRATSEGGGTFRTDSWMFGVILLGTVLIVGALLFMPLAVLGPVAEQLQGFTPAAH